MTYQANELPPVDRSGLPPATLTDRSLPVRQLGGGVVGFPAEDAGGLPQLNVNELLRIILKWKWLILAILVACTLLSIAITLATTPTYRANATMEINPSPVGVLGQQSEAQSQSQTRDPVQFLATQYGLLRSRSLAERVSRSLNLAADPEFVQGGTPAARQRAAAGKLAANLEVIPQTSGTLMEIAYTDEDPDRAARVVNAVATGFIASTLERRYNATAYARNFLQTRLTAVRARLEETERQLVRYAQAQGIVELSRDANGVAGDSLSAQSLTSINQALAAATADRIAAEQRYRQAQASGTTTQVLGSPLVQQLRAQRSQLQAEYEQKLATFKPDFPEMIALRSRMQSIDQNLAQETRDVSGSLRSAYLEAAGRERQLRGQVASLSGSVLDLRGRGINYAILQRDVDTNRALYDALLQRYKEIGVAGGVGESQAAIVDSAVVPRSPWSPNPLLNIGIGIVAGLILGFATAFAIEFIDDTIKSPEDILTKLKVPVLGLVPKIPKNSTLTSELADQRSEVSESYFSIMTALQFATPGGMPRSILITSSRAAEGKTSTSLALAQNLARVGASVLLIDADLRKPSFKGDATDGRGLSTLLTSQDSVFDHVVGTYVDNLSLLPGGTIPPNPAELLATGRITAILREAMERFDAVVVDAPPVLGLADAPILASLCDATVMVVQSGAARRPVLNSLARLIAANARLAGAMLTKYDPKTSGEYGYGYGYGYGETKRYGHDADTRPQIDMAS